MSGAVAVAEAEVKAALYLPFDCASLIEAHRQVSFCRVHSPKYASV